MEVSYFPGISCFLRLQGLFSLFDGVSCSSSVFSQQLVSQNLDYWRKYVTGILRVNLLSMSGFSFCFMFTVQDVSTQLPVAASMTDNLLLYLTAMMGSYPYGTERTNKLFLLYNIQKKYRYIIHTHIHTQSHEHKFEKTTNYALYSSIVRN